jgi:hypothetical protein
MILLSALAVASTLATAMSAPPPPERAPDPPISKGWDVQAGNLNVSKQAYAFIIQSEVGGMAYYEKALKRPTYPGGASGVTIGVGYDVGYNTASQVRLDWSGLPKGSVDALASAAGYKGAAAKARVPALRWILVPWPQAEKVFVQNTLPRFGNMTLKAFPGLKDRHGHCQGAILSIVFNRGPSKSGASRVEMANIDRHLLADRLDRVPPEIRSMKRLWVGKGLNGLLTRRDAEAALFQRGV